MKKNITKNILVAFVFLWLSGCASTKGVNDPMEPMNRVVFQFNDVLDKALLKPISQGYSFVLPQFVQTGVGNVFSNFYYPVVVTNQFLQGKMKLGVQDTGRFLINTTLGLVGIFDVADKFGLEEHHEDFGQTFASWGVGTGAYIVIPLFGPSNVRDGFGALADYYAGPWSLPYFNDHRATSNRLWGVDTIDRRAGLLKVEKLVSGDRYTFIRDAYMQKRADLVADGIVGDDDPFLDDDDE